VFGKKSKKYSRKPDLFFSCKVLKPCRRKKGNAQEKIKEFIEKKDERIFLRIAESNLALS
jgi:hypothetical protein